jgi:uncharacterized protein YlxW (UPF0749 family)
VSTLNFFRQRKRPLSCGELVLSRPNKGLPLLLGALAGFAIAAAALFAYLELAPEAQSVRELSRAHKQNLLLQKTLEQSRLEARMATAQTRELERQVDSLNRKLREQQDELAFFRKAGQGKH